MIIQNLHKKFFKQFLADGCAGTVVECVEGVGIDVHGVGGVRGYDIRPTRLTLTKKFRQRCYKTQNSTYTP